MIFRIYISPKADRDNDFVSVVLEAIISELNTYHQNKCLIPLPKYTTPVPIFFGT